MRSTIRQVAARANVSPMTVSHALNGRKQSMGADTYERVLEAVRELNYVPVRTAAQNRHVETRAIGVVPFHANFSLTHLDNLTSGGIYEGARKHGYDVLVMLRDEPDWMAHRSDVRFLDRRSDGFIFVSGGEGEWQDALNLLVEHNIPTVVCYRRSVPPEIAWIDPDNESIMRQLLDCFERHGHRRIAYLGAPQNNPFQASSDPNWLVSAKEVHSNYDDNQRRATFEAITSQNPQWEHSVVMTAATLDWKIIPEVLPALLEQGITGVICGSDFVAIQFLGLAQAAGLKVPEDLSVAGIDDFPEAKARGLTSVAFGYSEVGRMAVESWIKLRRGATPAECSRVIPATLVERTSVAAPRQKSLIERSTIMKLNTSPFQLNANKKVVRNSLKGFTLIELLVVIAIIALLAAILFPVFGRARENARRSGCQSNLKQISLAMTQYSQDYDETYPKAFAYSAVGTFAPGSGGAGQGWDLSIQPYLGMAVSQIRKQGLLMCPSDTYSRAAYGNSERSYTMAGQVGTGVWGYNKNPGCPTSNLGKNGGGFAGPIEIDGGGTGYCYSRGRKLSEIPDPAGTLQIVEMPSPNNTINGPNSSVVLSAVSAPAQNHANCGVSTASPSCGQDSGVGVDEPSHFEGWNYLFADGHVKWLKPEATVNGPGRVGGTVYNPKGMWTLSDTD